MNFLWFKKIFSLVGLLLWLTVLFVFIFIPVSLVFLLSYFPNVTVNQIVFHVLYLSFDDILPYSGVIVGFLLALSFLTYITYKFPYLLVFWVVFYGYVFCSNTQFQNIKVSNIAVDKQVPLIKQIKLSLQWSDVYDKYYKNPQFKNPVKKKNIIFIFAESMEDNFADEKYWGENLIPNLSELKKEGISFGGYEQINGTNWTLASNVSTFCGVPLRMHLRDRLGTATEKFMPNIKCLPDLLKSAGYHNVFVKGAYISFVGTDKFVSEHSFDEIYGRDEMIMENYASVEDVGIEKYGINDKKTFEFVRKKLSGLASENEPFFISIQTLDTHFPNGFVYPSCEVKYGDSRDAIKCSEKFIYNFVRWVQKQDFYDDTIVIIAGDHLMMSATDIADLSEAYPHRQIYNVVLQKGISPQIINKPHSMVDWSATIADMAGVVHDGKLGLGVSLFNNEKTLTEMFGAQKLEEELLKNSVMYNHFLDFDGVNKTDVNDDAAKNIKLSQSKMIAHIGKADDNIIEKLEKTAQRGYKYVEVDFASLPYDKILDFFEKHTDMRLVIGNVTDFNLIDERLKNIKNRLIVEFLFNTQLEQAKTKVFNVSYFLNNVQNIPMVLSKNYEFLTVTKEFLHRNKYIIKELRQQKGIKIMVYSLKNKSEVMEYDNLADMIYYDGEDNITAP